MSHQPYFISPSSVAQPQGFTQKQSTYFYKSQGGGLANTHSKSSIHQQAIPLGKLAQEQQIVLQACKPQMGGMFYVSSGSQGNSLVRVNNNGQNFNEQMQQMHSLVHVSAQPLSAHQATTSSKQTLQGSPQPRKLASGGNQHQSSHNTVVSLAQEGSPAP